MKRFTTENAENTEESAILHSHTQSIIMTHRDRYEGREAEAFRRELTRLGSIEGGWTTLFRHAQTGTYWKQTYPQSEYHGGGPALIERISEEDARSEFKI